MKKKFLCLCVVLLCTGLIQAQKKSIKGNFCGGSIQGNAFFSEGIRVGKGVFEYQGHLNSVKSYGMNKRNSKKVGAEYIVKYETDGEGANWASSITFTGKFNSRTKPCKNE
jgi:hypothetical protein